MTGLFFLLLSKIVSGIFDSVKKRSVLKIFATSCAAIILILGIFSFLLKDVFVVERIYLKVYNARSNTIETYFSIPPKERCAGQPLTNCFAKISQDNGSIKTRTEFIQRLGYMLEMCIFYDLDNCESEGYIDLLGQLNLESLLVNEYDVSAFSKREEYSDFLNELKNVKKNLTSISKNSRELDKISALLNAKIQGLEAKYGLYRFSII